ncbi:unnamed protein product [Wuchereria bancrofti]|uniref:Uncharacterized protein n=1 Tax=Wuchereria bancrofti TaxID=6293 RepID=A0A3P7FSK8_WUCBA|nr:unnamed protein product [Wuchereria bancrofti]
MSESAMTPTYMLVNQKRLCILLMSPRHKSREVILLAVRDRRRDILKTLATKFHFDDRHAQFCLRNIKHLYLCYTYKVENIARQGQ